MSSPPQYLADESLMDDDVGDTMTDASESYCTPGDVRHSLSSSPTLQARELGKFAASEEGRAVEQGLLRNFGDLLDNVEYLYRTEYIFSRLLRQWQRLCSPEVGYDNHDRYIEEALIAADPSWTEPENDGIFQSVKVALDVLSSAPWSSEMHTSGRYVWQESLMNVMTPLMFFLCEVRNAIKAVESERDTGIVILSIIKLRVVLEMDARPVLRCLSPTASHIGGSGRTEQMVASTKRKMEVKSRKESAVGSDVDVTYARHPESAWVRYSIAERIAIFDNYTEFPSHTPLATRSRFHEERTGKYRSVNAIKSQWQEMKRNGVTRETLEAKLSQSQELRESGESA